MKHLVIIGTVFPEPNSTAAGKRMLQLIDFFRSEHYRITFLSSANPSDFSAELSEKEINTQIIKLNDVSFETVMEALKPDIVLFDRFTTEEQFGWKITEKCPEAVKILDTEDLHFLRKARQEAFKQNKSFENGDLLNDIFKREMASILRCDLSLIISEFEMELLTLKFKIDPQILHYLPLFADNKESSVPFSARKNFVSIGNFLHEPNWKTVLQIKRLWKQIKNLIPEAEVYIYGAYTPEKALQLHNVKEGFLVKGRAENVATVFDDAKVLLAPIPFGAGIKGKLLECMAFGLPNVTTPVGAEGMHGELPWNGYIADNDADFIEKTVLLYTNADEWRNAQENGYRIVNERFVKKLFIPELSLRIIYISENLKQLRNENFLGQILQHHQHQSTKYLGKWIEEKNRPPK